MTTSTTPPAPTHQRWTASLWSALIVLTAANLMDAMDMSMVGVALPSIGEELAMPTSSLQWIISAYVLGFGGFLLLGGRAADLIGRRNVFLVSLAVFAIASFIGGFVTSGELLIASRFIKGVAAAFTAPAGLSLIMTTFPEGPMRTKALGVFTAGASVGFSLGLILSGLLTEANWRLTMFLPVPIAVAALVAGLRVLPRTPHIRGVGGYDPLGAVTVTAAGLLLVYTVVQAPEVGWGSAQTLISGAAVVGLTIAFLVVESLSKSPLIRLGILKNGTRARVQLGAMTYFGAYFAYQFIATLYLQTLLGWTPLQTALAFLPLGVLVAVTASQLGRIVGRFGPKLTMVFGFALFTLAIALFLTTTGTTNLWTVLPTMVLMGVGNPLMFASLNILNAHGVKDEEQGMAAGILNASLQIGGAIFLAIVTAVVYSNGGDTGNHVDMLAGYHVGTLVTACIAGAGLLLALIGLRPARTRKALSV